MFVCSRLPLTIETCQQSQQWWITKARKDATTLGLCKLYIAPMLDVEITGNYAKSFSHTVTVSQVSLSYFP